MSTSSISISWQQILCSLRYRGLGMTALACLANVTPLKRSDWYWQAKERQFDQRHGIDTGGLIPIESLDLSESDQSRGWGYMATQPEWFHRTLDRLEIDPREMTFVDYGSGKGRTLMLASALPFQQVVGVELSRKLHDTAVRNLEVWRRTHAGSAPMRSILADATTFTLPPGPAVCYFYNPFKEDVLRAVLARIRASYRADPRRLILIYANPTCKRLLDDASFLSTLSFDSAVPGLAIYEARPDDFAS